MEYKILKNYKSGILLTRQCEVVQEELIITFADAPENATAIFDNGNDSLYRLLQNNTCKIPVSFLSGSVSVSVAVLDGKTSSPAYVCEKIKATKICDNKVAVSPDDGNLPEKICKMQVDMQEIVDRLSELTAKQTELEAKIEKIIEGYDVT